MARVKYRGTPFGGKKAYKKARFKRAFQRFLNWCEKVGL